MTTATHRVSRHRSEAGRRVLIRAIEAVPHRADRHDRRVVRVAAELAAQIADVDVDNVRPWIVVVAPYGAEDLLAGEHVPAISHQVDEELELGRGQADELATAPHLPGEQIDVDAPGAE